MAKHRADNGIDYTPRRLKAIQAANKRPLERLAHGVVQRAQRYPIFEVTCAGKCIEWTDGRRAAHEAFMQAAALPKHLTMVLEDGRRVLLDMVSATGRRMSQQDEILKAA